MPHPFMVDPEKARMLPIFGNIPVRLETRQVQVGAYLKEIVLYNGIVNFYKREYRRLCVDPMLAIIEADEYSIAAKREALEALRRFAYPEIIYRLAALATNCSEKNGKIRSIIVKTAYKIFREVMHEAFELDGNGETISVKNIGKMMHRENIIDTIRINGIPELSKIAQNMHEKVLEKKQQAVILAMPFDSYIKTKPEEIYKLRNTRGIYIYPVLSNRIDDLKSALFETEEMSGEQMVVLKEGVSVELVMQAIGNSDKFKEIVE